MAGYKRRFYDEGYDRSHMDFYDRRDIYEPAFKRNPINSKLIGEETFPPPSAAFTGSGSGNNHFGKTKLNRNKFIKKQMKQKPFVKPKKSVTDAPEYTVLFQYLCDSKQRLKDGHIENIKKQIQLFCEEDKKKKVGRNWEEPVFLEFVSVENGLAVVCENYRSFDWLIKKKIAPVDDKMIVSCNAHTPIKTVKFSFIIKNCSDSADVVLTTLGKFNRGMKIRRFRVLEYKQEDGSVNMTLLTDLYHENKIKKNNYRVRYNLKGTIQLLEFLKVKTADDGDENSDNNDPGEEEGSDSITGEEDK